MDNFQDNTNLYSNNQNTEINKKLRNNAIENFSNNSNNINHSNGGLNNIKYTDEINQAKDSLKLLKLKMTAGSGGEGRLQPFTSKNQNEIGKMPITVTKVGGNNNNLINIKNTNIRKPFKPNFNNEFKEEDNFRNEYGNNNIMNNNNIYQQPQMGNNNRANLASRNNNKSQRKYTNSNFQVNTNYGK